MVGSGELLPIGGRKVEPRDACGAHDRSKLVGRRRRSGTDQYHGAAHDQRDEHLDEADVATRRAELQSAVGVRQSGSCGERPHVRQQALVRQNDTLGRRGRARRVENHGRGEPACPRHDRRSRPPGLRRRHVPARAAPVPEDDRGAGIPDHRRAPRGRERRIDRDRDAARGHCCQEVDCGAGRAVCDDADSLAATETLQRELGCARTDRGREVLVGRRGVDRRPVGPAQLKQRRCIGRLTGNRFHGIDERERVRHQPTTRIDRSGQQPCSVSSRHTARFTLPEDVIGRVRG